MASTIALEKDSGRCTKDKDSKAKMTSSLPNAGSDDQGGDNIVKSHDDILADTSVNIDADIDDDDDAASICTIDEGENVDDHGEMEGNADILNVVSVDLEEKKPESSTDPLPSKQHQDHVEYEVPIPATPHGLLLLLKDRNGAVTFDGYAKFPDGSKGPSEINNLVRNRGDTIVAVNGFTTIGLTFTETLDLMRSILKEDTWGFLHIQFVDGFEWRNRMDRAKEVNSQSMALNTGYEALEQMRKANLELEFGPSADLNQCTVCLRAAILLKNSNKTEGRKSIVLDGNRIKKLFSPFKGNKKETIQLSPSAAPSTLISTKKTVALDQTASSDTTEIEGIDSCSVSSGTTDQVAESSSSSSGTIVLDGSRIKKMMPAKSVHPCLICGLPVCKAHSSGTFRKEKIYICTECAPLFELDVIVDCIQSAKDNQSGVGNKGKHRQDIYHIVDVYDRALLMLTFSAQYIDDTASALEHNTQRNNKVGLGSSATGLVSGIAGVVGAATILTPVGPPLLIASLLFGGSATAASTTSETVNYCSEPRKLSDKIIALHAMVNSLLRVREVLRNALLEIEKERAAEALGNVPKIALPGVVNNFLYDERPDEVNFPMDRIAPSDSVDADKSDSAILTGAIEKLDLDDAVKPVAKNAQFFARVTTVAMRSARFARGAGGVLSAASIVIEVRDMKSTIGKIRAGNPCEKAEILRSIQKEMEDLPETSTLAKECDNFFTELESRDQALLKT